MGPGRCPGAHGWDACSRMGLVRQRAMCAGAATALIVAGVVLLGTPLAFAEPLPPPPGGLLVLDPTHGPPTAPVVAKFHAFTEIRRCPSAALFFWDSLRLGSAPFDKTCTATLAFVPPGSDRAPGPHTVTAAVPNGSRAARAYVVDGAVTPSPTPTRSPSPKVTTAAPTRTKAT